MDVSILPGIPALAPQPPPPMPIPTPPPSVVLESEPDFFVRLATQMRAFEERKTDSPALRLRRLYAALSAAYVEYVAFLVTRGWPFQGTAILIDAELSTKSIEDVVTCYARIVQYCEHPGMVPEDKHFLALRRLEELFSPPEKAA